MKGTVKQARMTHADIEINLKKQFIVRMFQSVGRWLCRQSEFFGYLCRCRSGIWLWPQSSNLQIIRAVTVQAMSTEVDVGVVLDNGGGSVKAGLVRLGLSKHNERGGRQSPLVATNALARPGPNAAQGATGTSKRPSGMLVGAEIDTAPDFSGMSFRRAHDRGYVARWDTQQDVWTSVFSSDRGIGLGDASSSSLLLTEPVATPAYIRRATNELVFETFGFAEYVAVSPARLVALVSGEKYSSESKSKTSLVLDSGFSFTHAVPVVNGWDVLLATRRLNLGGKALTNHLKETVSFRSWNMMEETAVVNAAKERTCYVSADFETELRSAKSRMNSLMRCNYILPDLSRGGTDPLGHMQREGEELDGSEQILVLNNERICIPELLFRPSNVGLPQGGVAEIIVQAVEAASDMHKADLYANIVLSGGNCQLPGFKARLIAELRPLVSENYALAVSVADEPAMTAYRGGEYALREHGTSLFPPVTRAEYEEHGHGITMHRFARVSADKL
jgi:actin-related protein 6